MPQLEIGGRRIQYSVVRGTSRRYTYLRFGSDLALEVVVPRGRRTDVEALIRERLDWITREYARAADSKRILSRDSVMFDGRPLKLVHLLAPEEGLTPRPEAGEVVISASDSRRAKELVRRWFLKETSAYVTKKVRECGAVLGVSPRRVDVREMSKWGYCTRSGRLSFSWQLIALSEPIREYVVLHELTHLIEFNHSRAFRKRLGTVCPDFRAREKELDLFLPYGRKEVW